MEKITIIPQTIGIAENFEELSGFLKSYKIQLFVDFNDESGLTKHVKKDKLKQVERALLMTLHTLFRKHKKALTKGFNLHIADYELNELFQNAVSLSSEELKIRDKNKVQEQTYENYLIKSIEYKNADTVGKLKEILNKYPDDMSVNFRNQPFQNLYYFETKENGFKCLAFQEPVTHNSFKKTPKI